MSALRLSTRSERRAATLGDEAPAGGDAPVAVSEPPKRPDTSHDNFAASASASAFDSMARLASSASAASFSARASASRLAASSAVVAASSVFTRSRSVSRARSAPSRSASVASSAAARCLSV
eukprot:7100-Pelagococcus_subviridis.AAC.1